MKLIIFLGNAGMEYEKSRHNLGFMMGNFYAKQNGVKWKLEKKFGAEIAELESSRNTEKTMFIKPQLLYNRTGEVVIKIARFYKVKPDDILAVCDDFNLDFGKIRFRKKGSDGGNNGLKSIIAATGDEFARIRIGTGNDLRQQIGETDFVLSNFNKNETAQLPEIFNKTAELIDEFINK